MHVCYNQRFGTNLRVYVVLRLLYQFCFLFWRSEPKPQLFDFEQWIVNWIQWNIFCKSSLFRAIASAHVGPFNQSSDIWVHGLSLHVKWNTHKMFDKTRKFGSVFKASEDYVSGYSEKESKQKLGWLKLCFLLDFIEWLNW